ncbi:MAG: hypothetical protein IPN83_06965 [Holophagales bacterium]|jgi:hypothetical protein|nr:hypothetical protein [Holophagales bacterium]
MEIQSTGRWELRTSDLADLVDIVGADVLTHFATSFLHADRIVSLTTMFQLSRADTPDGTPGSHRNFFAFASFLIGSLRELGEELKDLKSALVARDLFDESAWVADLERWELWGRANRVNTVRKKLCFHTDAPMFKKGLLSLAQTRTGNFTLIHGSSGKLRHGSFAFASETALEGLKKQQGTLELVGEPAQYLHVTAPLEREFIRILERLHLRPLLVTIRTGV